MAALSPICQFSKQSQVVILECTRLPVLQTNGGRENWNQMQSVKFCARGMDTNAIAAASPSRLVTKPVCLFARRSTTNTIAARPRHAILCRAAAARTDDDRHCRSMEDSLTAIMADVIQHCFNKECDDMRAKVVDQMGSGLAALYRMSVSVRAADNSTVVPIIPNKNKFAAIEDGDLEQVRRLLQLTSLPFHNSYEDDLQELMNMLQSRGEEAEQGRPTLTGSEFSQICERIRSDLVQCAVPLAMCFSELPLWAKQRALMLPAEVAGKVALSLLAGPKSKAKVI